LIYICALYFKTAAPCLHCTPYGSCATRCGELSIYMQPSYAASAVFSPVLKEPQLFSALRKFCHLILHSFQVAYEYIKYQGLQHQFLWNVTEFLPQFLIPMYSYLICPVF